MEDYDIGQSVVVIVAAEYFLRLGRQDNVEKYRVSDRNSCISYKRCRIRIILLPWF